MAADELDSLLAAAADLAQELSQDLGVDLDLTPAPTFAPDPRDEDDESSLGGIEESIEHMQQLVSEAAGALEGTTSVDSEESDEASEPLAEPPGAFMDDLTEEPTDTSGMFGIPVSPHEPGYEAPRPASRPTISEAVEEEEQEQDEEQEEED